jgi:hypothetical protein
MYCSYGPESVSLDLLCIFASVYSFALLFITVQPDVQMMIAFDRFFYFVTLRLPFLFLYRSCLLFTVRKFNLCHSGEKRPLFTVSERCNKGTFFPRRAEKALLLLLHAGQLLKCFFCPLKLKIFTYLRATHQICKKKSHSIIVN